MNESVVYVDVYKPTYLDRNPGLALMFAVAVGTVLLASCIANTPFDFLR